MKTPLFKKGDQIYYITEDQYGNDLEIEGWIERLIDESTDIEEPVYSIRLRGYKGKFTIKRESKLTRIECDYWENPYDKLIK